jgi:hypothetical protein
MACMGAGGLLIIYVAPEGAWVRLFVDGVDAAFTNSSRREGRVAGLAVGAHLVEAHLVERLSADEQRVVSRHHLKVHTCTCATPLQHENAPPPPLYTPYLPALLNPYHPSQRYMHHELFYLFGRWEGVGEERYLTDWLGVRTRYAWDCIKDGGYYKFVPSRRLECEEYEQLEQDGRIPSSPAHAHANTTNIEASCLQSTTSILNISMCLLVW